LLLSVSLPLPSLLLLLVFFRFPSVAFSTMTTSHKPTYHPAIGRVHAGGYRFDAKRAQYSSRDMARHMTLKVRNDLGGQNAAATDKQLLREKLFEQENKHKQSIRDGQCDR
jgi:hypothetical protein